MEIREVSLEVTDDLDGSGTALRGWLTSTGPETGWIVQPARRSDGQGLAQDITLYLNSAVAALSLYDRVRQWITSRGKQAKPVVITAAVEAEGVRSTVTVTLEPKALEGRRG